MKTVELEHVLAQQDVASIISRFAAASDSPFAVKDENFTLLQGRETDDQPETYPVECNGSVMGWVSGKQEASLLASFISFAATHEYEKRFLEQAGSPQRGAEASMEPFQDYRFILEQAADVIYCVDRDFIIEYVSSSVKHHLGYLPEELRGRSFTELGLLTEESLNRAISNTIGIFKGEAVPTAEYELITRDGRIRVAEIRSTPIYKNGAVVSIVSVARDITEQRKTEQALEASESRFRTMAEKINSGLIIMEEGNIVYANNYVCQLCGYTRDEMISIWGPDLTAAQSENQRDQILKSVHETGLYPEQVDIWMNCKDGTQRCLNLRFSFSYSAERKQTGYVIVSDITERKQIEDRMLATKNFLDNIIDNSIDAIVMADTSGCFKRVNKAYLALTGYTEEEVLGKHMADFSAVMGEEYALTSGERMTMGQQYMDYTVRMAERMMNEKKIANWESYLVRKDGTAVPVETNITYFFNEQGVDTAVGIIRDITDRKKADAQLRETSTYLENIIKTSADGIVVCDVMTRVTMMNDAAERILGYSKEELMGRNTRDFIPGADLDKRDMFLETLVGSKENLHTYGQKWKKKDGTIIDLSLSIGAIQDSSERVTGFVTCIRDITEQLHAEESMRETMCFLDSIIQSSIDAILISDNKRCVTRVNKAFCDLTAYSPEEILGKHMHDFSVIMEGTYEDIAGDSIEINADYIDYNSAMAAQLMSEKKIINWDSYLIRKDGKVVPVEVNIVYLYDKHGLNTGTLGILRNTIDRKKAEKELTETKEFLENIIESSLDPIVIGDKLGNITRVNRAFAQLVGFTSEEILGMHLAELVPPRAGLYESADGMTYRVEDSFYDRSYEQMYKLIESGYISNWDSYCFKKNGMIIPVEQTMFYSYDKKGNRQAVISINRDVSERKKAEKTIIDTKNFLGDIIRTSADGIVVTDTVGTITLVNEAVERILGYSKEELLGKNTHDFMVVPDGEMRDDFVETPSTAMDSVYYYESKWKGKNGRLVDLGMSVSTLQDYSNNTTGMVACVRDITDRKAAEQKLFEYQNQLRCLASQLTLTEEQERRRIATEIHDRIAQSLALAKIKLGALGMAVQSSEKAKDVVVIRSLLEQSIKDTRSLIFDLSPPFLYEFGLEKALEWLLDDIEKQHGVRIHLEYNGSQGDYDDDVRVLLYQSIRELLINVVKHAKAKTATVSLDRNAQKVHVCVEDDGQGFLISPDGLQVNSGGGYGLFSIKERFHHLGGAITVDSRLNHGTRISLDLPLVQHGA